MSNLAFEITVDDLDVVFRKLGIDNSDLILEDVFEEHIESNLDRIESAALAAKVGVDDEETIGFQTFSAYDEIAEILKDEGVIPGVERCPECNKLVGFCIC